MPSGEAPAPARDCLLSCLREAAPAPGVALHGARATVPLAQLVAQSSLQAAPGALAGRSVLLHTTDPLTAALGLVELDGLARRIVLCPPGLPAAHLQAIAATAEVEAVVGEPPAPEAGLAALPFHAVAAQGSWPARGTRPAASASEWVLLTSGTSGVPKLVVHTLQTLTGAIGPQGPLAGALVWSTFYDVRRYGGLQILLRALLGGGALVLAAPEEPMDGFLARALAVGATHITGTPSHWRRALLEPLARQLQPRYARMSGEIADQAIIDRLRAAYPQARVAHAYASTEAGVAFEVDDGLEGFACALVDQAGAAVSLRVVDDSLHIHSARTALRYLGPADGPLRDAAGYVDTGDMVALRAQRYHFVGRRGGIINVGGLKVHPEEIEAVINRHPGVRMSLVKARRNPITGAVVVAEVVPAPGAQGAAALQAGILELCRAQLAPYKVPALVRVVPQIEVSPSGKVVRADA
jgi:acyl-CoA synthetase (AMP-forming)/AMP-acid ligase II